MQKALDGLVKGLRRYSLSIGVLGLALIIGGTHYVTAQQGGGNNNANSLGNHHQELTLTIDPGEFTYVPFPKKDVPINFQVSVPRFYAPETGGETAAGPYVATFTATDFQAGTPIYGGIGEPPYATITPILAGYEYGIAATYPGGVKVAQVCQDAAFFNASTYQTYYLSNQMGSGAGNTCTEDIKDGFVIGLANVEEGVPNRVIMGIPNPTKDESAVPLYGPVTVRVHLWY